MYLRSSAQPNFFLLIKLFTSLLSKNQAPVQIAFLLFSQPVEKYLDFSTTFPQKSSIFYSTIDLLKAENLLPRLRSTEPIFTL